MSTHETPPLPSRRATAPAGEQSYPAGLSLDTLRGAVSYARERLEGDLRSFVVFDRASGEAVIGGQTLPEGNRLLFELSRAVDSGLPAGDLSAVREWWLLDLTADRQLVVFINLGPRHRGIMLVHNSNRQVAKVFGNVVPAILMQCREGW